MYIRISGNKNEMCNIGGMIVSFMDVATVPAPVLQLQYRYTSIIKRFLISAQDFEVDR